MERTEKQRQLAEMLRQIAPHDDLAELEADPTPEIKESNQRSPRSLEEEVDLADHGLRALIAGRPEDLSDGDMLGLEAIVLPKYRPVVDIINDDFNRPQKPWRHLGSGVTRENLMKAIPSVGRVEVPRHHRLPYAGTGFVVGDNLLMTNRHVAEVFAAGLGDGVIFFRSGQTAALDFKQEIIPSIPELVWVQKIRMIHPHWDMALLEVKGLEDRDPLTLEVAEPAELQGVDVAVVGYPAQDVRNDLDLQNQVFRGKFNVKRLQPGKIRGSEAILDGYKNQVDTLTHDCSTLGGNSGSAVIDASTGNVVGLHFAGRYLKSNYAVPMHALAQDARVVSTGVNFNGNVPATNAWERKWKLANEGKPIPPDEEPAATSKPSSPPPDQAPQQQSAGENDMSAKQTVKITVPLEISVTIGESQIGTASVAVQDNGSPAVGQEISLRLPKIYDHLEERKGYQEAFLGRSAKVPLPKLTRKGEKVVAKLEDGSHVLNYHKFSVVMHKLRRLALFTASNVDYRPENQKIDGKKPTRKELTEIPEGFGEQWVTDPRLPHAHQLPDVFFTKDRTAFDKGHLVRRNDVVWGSTFEDIQKANGDTYHTTNCSPQTGEFNRSNRGKDNWGDLENFIQKETSAQKAVIFAGPVFDADDPIFEGRDKHGRVEIPIPQSYWKIVVVNGDDGLQAYGFVLEQDLSEVDFTELAIPENWANKQVRISEIEKQAGKLLDLDDLKEWDMA